MTERCGVVVAHGRLADGLLSALERVAGKQENLWPVSSDGMSRESLLETVTRLLEERSEGREAFLFSDLAGGSCGQVGRRLLDAGHVVAAFHGTNLPVLIEFVFHRAASPEELVEVLTEKGPASMEVAR
ncbi:MAG: PTS N-acetylgalactosamine transporter subunit IIA [Gemmatimonadota bacterium]|nr:PTS N-acetylgalactosamine transporter subunit IIA [Gemmatimonadota bacterium]